MFRYCTSNGCNIQDGSIYSEGNLNPPQTEPPETESPEPDELAGSVTEEVEEEEPALVIDFGPDETEESSSSMTIQSLLLAILLLCVNF